MTHGDVATFAQFGIEAGRGEQKVRQEVEAEVNARQQAAIDAQATANALRASTDITKTILNAQSRREAEEFESFMRGESAKRAIAWQQEKTELGNLHDFEMLEQRKEIENQLAISADMRQKSKMDSKIQSLRDAQEQGQLSEKQMNDEILRLELGIPGSLSPLFKKKDEASVFADLLAERETRGDIAPEQTNSTALLELSTSPTTSAEDKADIEKIIAEGDDVKIRVALDSMRAKKQAEGLGRAAASVSTASFTPGGHGFFGL